MTESPLAAAARLRRAGQLREAARLYADALRANPNEFEALLDLGLIHYQAARFSDAERLIAAALRVDPDAPQALYLRGCVQQAQQRQADAIASFARALELKPDFVEAHNNRGVSLLGLGRYDEALVNFDRMIAAHPELAIVHANRATALQGLGRFEEALAAADVAIGLGPPSAEYLCRRGAALAALERNREALAAFNEALALQPQSVEVLSRRGIVLATLGIEEQSLADFEKALRLAPDNSSLHYNRGHTLMLLRRHAEAAAEFEHLLKKTPDFPFARGNLVDCRLQLCHWRGLDEEIARVDAGVINGARVIRPLQYIAVSQSEADQRRCARIWADYAFPEVSPLAQGARYGHERIRIAYVSADFRDHSVAMLAAGVFERHDRRRFESFGLSIGADDGSAMRARLAKAFDHFIDGRDRSDADLARLLHENEIDIAVDLMGSTVGSRTPVFAHRPAPVQVSWLGFPGTMGVPFLNYLLADPITAPQSSAPHFDEKIVHLPGCYLPNDDTRALARAPSRTAAGLPERGFVFSAFNPTHKIRLPLFDIWMRLLAAVPESVLWLSWAPDAARRSLLAAARARRVDDARLIFAPFVSAQPDHLARLSLADLYLDTLPYNAHASACDSLWAGVPAVSCRGKTFAGRVGASLLSTLGLPELIAHSPADYEAIALRLAQDAGALAAVREKLAQQRSTAPLFDTTRFTRHLEAAFQRMWARNEAGLLPEAFAVGPVADAGP
jgi:protein O-GlcNAc transferase